VLAAGDTLGRSGSISPSSRAASAAALARSVSSVSKICRSQDRALPFSTGCTTGDSFGYGSKNEDEQTDTCCAHLLQLHHHFVFLRFQGLQFAARITQFLVLLAFACFQLLLGFQQSRQLV
jgi:hypothetical protein